MELKNEQKIAALEQAVAGLIHYSYFSDELGKDPLTAARFKSAVLKLELPYNNLMDAAKRVQATATGSPPVIVPSAAQKPASGAARPHFAGSQPVK